MIFRFTSLQSIAEFDEILYMQMHYFLLHALHAIRLCLSRLSSGLCLVCDISSGMHTKKNMNVFIKFWSYNARSDWSIRVHYNSIKHTPYTVRHMHALLSYNALCLCHKFESAQFHEHFIKEIVNVLLVHC